MDLLQSKACGQGATIHQEGTTKSWRGFVDKTKARLTPGSVQLYSGLFTEVKMICTQISAGEDGGPCSQVCASLTLRSAQT